MDLTQLLSRHEGHDHADMAGMDMGTSANASSADPGMGMDMGMGMSSCKSELSPHLLLTQFIYLIYSCQSFFMNAHSSSSHHHLVQKCAFDFAVHPVPALSFPLSLALAIVRAALTLIPVSMLWNWNTVDSCFLAESWHVKTKGAFAGSVIGVFILVILIEALRRGAREYDRYLVRSAMVSAGYSIDGGNGSGSGLVRNGSGDDTKVLGNVEGQIKPPFEYVPSSHHTSFRIGSSGS